MNDANEYMNILFCSGKATYRLNAHRGNLRDGYYFIQQNNDKRIIIKSSKDKDSYFVTALKRAVLNGSTTPFLIFSYEQELTVSFISFLEARWPHG